MQQEPTPTYNPHPTPPQLKLPAGACDAHVHVFGPASRFPYAAERHTTPADATKEQLFALHKLMGIARCVVVQSLVHGYDNAAVKDTIEAGGGRYLGVALVPIDVADAELARLAAAGFRGVRFHWMGGLNAGASVEQVVAFSRRLAPLGMHLQLHFSSSEIHAIAGPMAQSAVPVVIDHIARVDASLGADHADFSALMLLMRNPLFHVKVSGVDRIDRHPPYAQGVPLARMLVEQFADRCFWGSDWPHPNHTHVPDDATLVEQIAKIAPTPALLQQLMVTNPMNFYRFPK